MISKLREMQANNACLLATNFYNYETLRGILRAASNLNTPVILQLTKSSIDYMGLSVAVNLAKSSLEEYNVEGWLHLDHSITFELVQECLDMGFDSVMIDASEKPLEENIEITQKVVELAKQYGANVEAELGYIAKLGQSKEKTGFTDPEQARYFVQQTGINALAIAIGSAHGFYVTEPKLDLNLLAKIRTSTNIPLVLHGGSGIPGNSLKEAINLGICKINLATEIKNIFMQTLKSSMSHNEDIDLRNVFPSAIEAVTELVSEKLRIVNT
ncbi:class II fructose-bisphosphate aldolase [Dyadobacter tibetensis]|uniref:class II fructose-bisphosphate aldolase n=1 Tax=Dyadobacter tibetensis TaxID=1211851 RepID=UPI00046FAD37|nr:class II fructose-bisphosphate aldolase [Dyadobacter tibetensis]